MAMIDSDEDKKAFENLVHTYEKKLYGISYGILQSHTLAEDAVLNTFISVAKNFQKINTLSVHKLEAYLIKSIRNASYRIYNLEKEHMYDISVEQNDLVLPNVDSFENYNTDILSNAISELDERYQSVIAYMFYYGLNADETAKAMHIARRTVYKYRNAALKILAHKLGGDKNE
jgi:RNA polymerase sigma-70 factor (ECF subfamily)